MDFLPFLLTALLLELTPGPNMIWLVLLAAFQGREAGIAATAGIALGLLVLVFAASFGMAQLVSVSPAWMELLRWVGAAYLLYLAWDAWPRGATVVADGPRADGSVFRHFRDGLVINLLNAKSALFFVLAVPEFTNADQPYMPQALVLGAVYVGVATTIHLTLVALAGRAHDFLARPSRARMIARTGSVLIALVALWLVVRR